MKTPKVHNGVRHGSESEIAFSEYSNFILVTLIGVLLSTIWLYVGEPWGLRGDARHYLQLYDGEMAKSPFGYRILTPWLASLFSSIWSYWTNFKIVSIACLALTGALAYQLIEKKSHSLLQNVSMVIFWTTSFAFAYYSTTIIRPDSVMFFLLALLFMASNQRAPFWILLTLLTIGIFAHETILIFIPALWIDHIFRGDLSNGGSYKLWELITITTAAIIVFVLSRRIINVLPHTDPNYLSSPFEMIRYSLDYSGGFIKYILRIYASYGPTLIFCFFYLLFFSERRTTISFFILFFVVAASTFLATDTLRIMSVLSIPVFFYASRYISKIWDSGNKVFALSLIALQVGYSYIVFGHLRTFEKSSQFIIMAGLISLLALVACGVMTYRMKAEIIFSRLR